MLDQKIMVQSHRGGHVGLRTENYKANPVVGAFIDKPLENVAGHIEAVHAFASDFEILGNHAAGHVEGSDNIDPTGIDLGFTSRQPWLRQGDDEQRERQPAERREKAAGTSLSYVKNSAHQLYRRIDKAGRFAAFSFEPREHRQ